MLKFHNLRNKLSIYILIPVLVGIAILISVSYYTAWNTLNRQVNSTLQFMTQAYNGQIVSWFAEKEAAVTNIAEILSSKDMSEEEQIHLLATLKQTMPEVSNIYVGYADKRDYNAIPTVLPPGFDPTSRPWYKKAVAAQGKIAYSDFYLNTNKEPRVSIVKAMQANGQTIGVVAADISLDHLRGVVQGIKVGDTGYAFLMEHTGAFLYHPSFNMTDNIGKVEPGSFPQDKEWYLNGEQGIATGSVGGKEIVSAKIPVGKTGWTLVANAPVEELFAGVTALRTRLLIGGLILILLVAFVVFYVARGTVQPLTRLAGMADEIARGNLTGSRELNYHSQDEIGKLAASFATMAGNLRSITLGVSESAAQVAAASEQLSASAEQSAQAANQVAVSITEVAQGTENQAKATVTTTATIEKMSAGVQQASANANNVASVADQTSQAANDGSQAIGKAVSQMKTIEESFQFITDAVNRLNQRSQEIEKFVEAISGIAGQTNLLALNAAIEAARAGEQGKGFAVVAEEVRKLAEQSQQAAKQIAVLIHDTADDTEKAVLATNSGSEEVKTGTEVVNKAGRVFSEIQRLVNEVTAQIEQISATIQQLADNSQEIVSSVESIDTITKETAAHTQTVSAATEEESASMEEIAASSQKLSALAQKLQDAINKFKV
ncbi:MAG: methyl-accepting chemotaxis protein [Veillonellales bacterium]